MQGHSYGMGVATGDYDNDGYTDLYVTNLGGGILYHNNGDGTFTDVTRRAGVTASGWPVGACFVDYDHATSKLDLQSPLDWDFGNNPVCGENQPAMEATAARIGFRPSTSPVSQRRQHRPRGCFPRNQVSMRSQGKGLGVAVNDYDRDGWPDIVVANDSFPQKLFRNNRDGTFTEVALQLGLAYDDDGKTFAGMGVDFADYDNDGWPDIFVNALASQRYALFRNQQGKSFDYVSGPSGVAGISKMHSGWGARFFDYDNDGWKDLFVAQGHVMDNIELTQPSMRYKEPLLLMHNNGTRFADVSASSGEPFRASMTIAGARHLGDPGNV